MDVLFTNEQRYDRTPDGKIWTPAQYAYPVFRAFMDVFDRVKVVARVRDVESVPSNYLRADGENVSFEPIPYYHGMSQYFKRIMPINAAIRQSITFNDAIILTAGSMVAEVIIRPAIRQQFPFGVVVVVDPDKVFAAGGMRHPLRPLLQRFFVRLQQRHCARASAASYVTKSYLQQLYPCPGLMVGVSDVVIDDAALVAAPHEFAPGDKPVHLVFVGSFEQMYKAPDILVEAMQQCVANGLQLKLTMIGEGVYRPEIEALVERLGLAQRITFTGMLPGASAVRAVLDEGDLFVMPSRVEGMPRAMIEAMARGLPAIGTTVGGIPELLPPEDMVPPGDAPALAQKITEFVTRPERLNAAAARNLAAARDYQYASLQQQRNRFYQYMHDQTRQWMAANKQGTK
jgi:glycosyltransferase involved in cell wall biosynthesis